MINGFPIDFVRQAIEQRLYQEHLANPNFIGGRNQVALFSLYEQLLSGEDVDRYVETFRELTEQQNRSSLILNGVLSAPENPTITNIYSSMIIPMDYTCVFKCKTSNRDQALETMNNMIEKMKGRKVDIAELKCQTENGYSYVPFVVGTIGQGDGEPQLKNGDYIGEVTYASDILNKLYDLEDLGFDIQYKHINLYCSNIGKIKVAQCIRGNSVAIDDIQIGDSIWETEGGVDYLVGVKITLIGYDTFTHKPLLYNRLSTGNVEISLINDEVVEVNSTIETTKYELNNAGHVKFEVIYRLSTPIPDGEIDDGVLGVGFSGIYFSNYAFAENDGSIGNIVFPPEHESFKKYKLSLSFDAMRCDTPFNLNGNEVMMISFGGSATLVSEKVKLGNDLVKISIHKNKIVARPTIDLSSSNTYYLEPLEMPSGSNANTQINQLISNKFKSNTHTDGLSINLQYSFIADDSIDLLKQWFDYGRYGIQDTTNLDLNERISPNIIYDVAEYWSTWGVFKKKEILGKIVGDIDIENSESDTLTIGVSIQVQGENN